MDNQTTEQRNSCRGDSRRIYQLRKHYKETGKIPKLKKAGRKPKPITKETEENGLA